ncbi:putative xyloglucan endotransglucosylase/hydrolase protein 6 [Gossypium australe]|uniref:Putative xyloglucan endotransglucosylase/hydrolase protein 6 n=1 Tax=Gossypium australe TaxID=47621 RepID=A0A5B6VXR4_9ROSI|nr:putative xyloglucan endotransglucosylase/hydrolase protein 6 [Gossypium australe]
MHIIVKREVGFREWPKHTRILLAFKTNGWLNRVRAVFDSFGPNKCIKAGSWLRTSTTFKVSGVKDLLEGSCYGRCYHDAVAIIELARTIL